MATTVQLVHSTSGLRKKGYYGFSWTTLFFGAMPSLFRGDPITFVLAFAVLFVLALASYGLAVIPALVVWAFMYNRFYTRRLLEQGYQVVGTEEQVHRANFSFGVATTHS